MGVMWECSGDVGAVVMWVSAVVMWDDGWVQW